LRSQGSVCGALSALDFGTYAILPVAADRIVSFELALYEMAQLAKGRSIKQTSADRDSANAAELNNQAHTHQGCSSPILIATATVKVTMFAVNDDL